MNSPPRNPHQDRLWGRQQMPDGLTACQCQPAGAQNMLWFGRVRAFVVEAVVLCVELTGVMGKRV